MNARILIVDDSQVEQNLIGGLLQANPDWQFAYAENGKEALEILDDFRPTLLITDLVMPEMDGLGLLEAMRNEYPTIPVILLTAYGNEELAVAALRAGAASYVPKSKQAELLVDTVESVLDRSLADLDRRRIATRLHDVHYSYRLENDPSLISPLVDELQRIMASMDIGTTNERIRTGLALEQALLNAMYHGNLEISAKEMAEARANHGKDGVVELAKSKCSSAEYCDREVTFSARFTNGNARFVIHDDGKGFHLNNTMTPRLDRYFEEGQSRGLMLLYSNMDEVKFNDRGNEVVMFKTGEQSRATAA